MAWKLPTKYFRIGTIASGARDAIVPILKYFVGSFLAIGFVHCAHKRIVGLIDVRVVLASAHKGIGVAFAVECFHVEPTVTVEAPVRIGYSLRKCGEVRNFFWFHLDDVLVQVIALCSDRAGRRKT